jgi:Cu2+-containing amine oxidase
LNLPARQPFAVLFDNALNACHDGVVSIERGVVKSWYHIPSVEPTMTLDDAGDSRRGARPLALPPGACNYAADRVTDQRQDIKPMEITHSDGPSFVVEGY